MRRGEHPGLAFDDDLERAARTGRNPRTGEAVEVTGKAVPYFKPGKELRERVCDAVPLNDA